MLIPTYVKALSVAVYLLMTINLANVMVVQKDLVLSGLNDGVVIDYRGKDQIYVLTSDLSDAFISDVINTSGGGVFSGRIYMRLSKQAFNLSDAYFMVVLYSPSPYVINVSRVSSEKVLTDILNSPGNVSLQLTFRLINNLTGSYVTPTIQIPMYLRAPIWNVAIVLVVLTMFISTAVLDVRSYSQLKKDRWGVEESVALLVRYLLYGSLTAFIVSVVATVGLTIYNNIVFKNFSFDISWLLIPFIILFLSAVVYYACKWKGWYDVIDEE